MFMERMFWKKKEDNIQCGICPHRCVIPPGKYGLCGGRVNESSKAVLLAQPVTLALDPIEKKPLYHFYPGTNILSTGTYGCNLKCSFCQNWTLSQSKAEGISHITSDEIVNAAVKLVCQNNIGLAYTYNEPSIWFEGIYKIAQKIKELNLKNVLVTNGYLNLKPLKLLLKFIDAINLDIKSIDDSFYKKYCKASLKPVLKYAVESKKSAFLEITNLIIPTLNDTDRHIQKLAKWIAVNLGDDTPLHLSAYFPKYEMEIPPAPPETIERLRLQATEYLKYVYTGNIHTENGCDTICPKCSEVIIKRNIMGLTKNFVKEGKCPYCSAPINIITR